MRITRSIPLLAALALTAVSCNVEEPLFSTLQKGFTASIEAQSGLSRTSLSGTSVLWSEGDTILVCKVSSLTDAVKVGINPADAGKPSGRFYDPACEEYCNSQCYALYPASMAGEPSGSSLTVELPAEQKYSELSFADFLIPLIYDS